MKGKNGLDPRKVPAFEDFRCVLLVLISLAVFTYYSVVKLFRTSFMDWNLLNDRWQYMGIKNWKWLFGGSGTKYLWNLLRMTFSYSLGELSITPVGGMIFALILNRMTKGFSIMRMIVLMPKHAATFSAAVVFLWVLNADHGILGYFLSMSGSGRVDWLNNRSTALSSVLLLMGWRCISYGMMMHLSAMMGTPTDYYEAAFLDGTSAVQRLFQIVLPMLSSITLFLLVTTFPAFMKVFQSIDISTQGGPYRSTEVFVYNTYRCATVDFRMDRTSMVAIFFLIILLVITVVTMKVSNGKANYNS